MGRLDATDEAYMGYIRTKIRLLRSPDGQNLTDPIRIADEFDQLLSIIEKQEAPQ